MSIPNHLFEALLSICRTPENRELLLEAIKSGGGDLTADEIAYDNTESGLAATELQDAVDELAAGSGGSGANLTLSNLEAPTAINQSLIPDTTNTYKLGSVSDGLIWNQLAVAQISATSIFASGAIKSDTNISSGFTSLTTADFSPYVNIPSDAVTNASILEFSHPSMTGGGLVGNNVFLTTMNQSGVDASKDVYISTGDSLGNTGDIEIYTGTGAVRGSINMNANAVNINATTTSVGDLECASVTVMGNPGVTGTFTSQDGKTISVTNGIIIGIEIV